ncbi:MAG TPA: ATP-binding protein, partial [Planctomycetaceae bacterium]|nr:ATP-binding protein [Planctomycetaceae bacterium]
GGKGRSLGGGDFNVEFRVTWPDGSTHWLRDQGKVFTGPDGRPLFMAGAAMDITERRRMEEELRDADRRKDDFLALLAHELRNPLAPIRNGLQVLRLSEDRETRGRLQAMMDRQLTHMVRLIDDLLDVSRINRNKMELRRSHILLADALSSAIETARPMIEAAGHELTTNLPADPITLDADLTRLAQVFSNLLTNSAKYTERGGRIALAARSDGAEVLVTVTDTGIGIPAESLPRIFDMFSQVDRPIERSTGGLGIGLALVKGLVEMHGGTVTAASGGQGLGCRFTVRLPVIPLHPERPADLPVGQNGATSGKRILVVDDNRDSAQSMGEMLSLLGHQVALAHDGLQAVERAGALRPDIILMDVGMPRLNGYEATRRIREHPWGQGVSIIALTGWGQESDRSLSKDAGCDGHLVKPVSLSELEKAIGEWATGRG